MNFSEALELMKQGTAVRRKGWRPEHYAAYRAEGRVGVMLTARDGTGVKFLWYLWHSDRSESDWEVVE